MIRSNKDLRAESWRAKQIRRESEKVDMVVPFGLRTIPANPTSTTFQVKRMTRVCHTLYLHSCHIERLSKMMRFQKPSGILMRYVNGVLGYSCYSWRRELGTCVHLCPLIDGVLTVDSYPWNTTTARYLRPNRSDVSSSLPTSSFRPTLYAKPRLCTLRFQIRPFDFATCY